MDFIIYWPLKGKFSKKKKDGMGPDAPPPRWKIPSFFFWTLHLVFIIIKIIMKSAANYHFSINIVI